jgi:hypothetical protein
MRFFLTALLAALGLLASTVAGACQIHADSSIQAAYAGRRLESALPASARCEVTLVVDAGIGAEMSPGEAAGK